MLHLQSIRELEDYFHERKRITLDAIGREPSEAVTDIYVKGFLRQILEKITYMCPEIGSGYIAAEPRDPRGSPQYFTSPNSHFFHNNRTPNK